MFDDYELLTDDHREQKSTFDDPPEEPEENKSWITAPSPDMLLGQLGHSTVGIHVCSVLYSNPNLVLLVHTLYMCVCGGATVCLKMLVIYINGIDSEKPVVLSMKNAGYFRSVSIMATS